MIQGRPTKNYSVGCIQENHQKFVPQPWSNLFNFPQYRDFPQLSNFLKKWRWNPLIEHSPRILRRTGNPKKKKKPISDHQRNLIRENSFIYCRAVDRTSRFYFLFWLLKKIFKKNVGGKKVSEKICQVGRQIIFLIWIFFFVKFFVGIFSRISKNGGKSVDRTIDWVRGNFSIFLTEFVGQKKVRDLGRALPGSCGNFRKKSKKK